jgi:hypothetical protein
MALMMLTTGAPSVMDYFIVFYDIYSTKIENMHIRRNKFSPILTYGGKGLYYFDGKYLYVSFDIYNFTYIFATLPSPAPRKWYRYDFETKKRIRVKVPSDYVIILGSTSKQGTPGNRQNQLHLDRMEEDGEPFPK